MFVFMLFQTGKDLLQFRFPPGLVVFQYGRMDQGGCPAAGTGDRQPFFPADHDVMGCFHLTVGTGINLTEIGFQASHLHAILLP